MDIALMAVGAGMAVWGWHSKSGDGRMQPWAVALLGIGSLVAIAGLVIFLVAFAGGFSEGFQQGSS